MCCVASLTAARVSQLASKKMLAIDQRRSFLWDEDYAEFQVAYRKSTRLGRWFLGWPKVESMADYKRWTCSWKCPFARRGFWYENMTRNICARLSQAATLLLQENRGDALMSLTLDDLIALR